MTIISLIPLALLSLLLDPGSLTSSHLVISCLMWLDSLFWVSVGVLYRLLYVKKTTNGHFAFLRHRRIKGSICN
ncbi:hypothetical protein B0I35DRAFT_74809 [Stachybotrys elegans]|uniref:Uncharacterized protein n=1 Tax=Stachybotrys elegans TaxID=80388 RepID=A0A8K0SN74_9HYPO|nr:hypothetical protein B0I35DRAFT_74809 [Stachybotrys elegans]